MAARVVFDIEANGLRPTHIHCWSASGGNSGTTVESFQQAVVDSGATLVAHNGIGYDFPVLGRLWGVDFRPNQLRDSLVLSRLARPDRSGHKKPHSLEAWGERLGFPKVEHEDWDNYSPEMQHRCDTDVIINEKALEVIEEELEGFSEESIELEHEVAWIIAEQERNGWLLDDRKTMMLAARLRDQQVRLENEVHQRFHPLITPVGNKPEKALVTPKHKQDGSLSKVGLNHLGDQWGLCGGPFSKVCSQEFNLGSRQQIGRWLQWFGWEPQKFTETGQPQVDEKVLEGVTIPEAQLILEYITVGKIAQMCEKWLEFQQDDGRVYGQVNSCGAVTGRMTHSNPNVAQVPARTALGQECRECWTVPEGYKLVGMDADGLELRMLAHYMADPEYVKAVVEGSKEDGTDAHSVNMRAAGLPDRDTAKTFIYAFMYGAGDAKIALIAGLRGRAKGKALKDKFLARTPALKGLINRVKQASRRGWLKGLDGRKVYVRSQHAALNTLLQSAGAIIMKKALVILYNQAKTEGLEFALVGNIHDEIQAQVREDHAERFGEIAADSVRLAGEHFNLRCPLAGSYAVGLTWRDTH